MRRAAGVVLRIAVVSALAVAIGAVIVVGWPVVYDRYIAPIQANTNDLGALRERIDAAEVALDDVASGQEALETRIGAVEGRIEEHTSRLATLDGITDSLASADQATRDEIDRRTRLLKAMELMSRARLFLFQSNFGLAEQDVAAARDLLAGLARTGVGDEQALIPASVVRLDRALDALPEFPVSARDDIDIAWLALLGEVPRTSPEPIPSPSPGASPSP